MTYKAHLWYQCHNCGNKALSACVPDNRICGGCKQPDWKLMRYQETYWVEGKDWIHPDGVDLPKSESGAKDSK